MTVQIFWGSLLLVVCSAMHLALLIRWMLWLKHYMARKQDSGHFWRVTLPMGGTFVAIVFSHTLQVWLWAGVLVGLGAMAETANAIYFSLVTYTTLGYGDVLLGDDFRIFGAMAAVTGLLNFGISTAILVALLSRTLPRELHAG